MILCCAYRHFLGGSAKAAGELVKKQGGVTIEYIFIIELMFLKGYQKLDAPAYSIIQSLDWVPGCILIYWYIMSETDTRSYE